MWFFRDKWSSLAKELPVRNARAQLPDLPAMQRESVFTACPKTCAMSAPWTGPHAGMWQEMRAATDANLCWNMESNTLVVVACVRWRHESSRHHQRALLRTAGPVVERPCRRKLQEDSVSVLELFVDCLGWQFCERKRSIFLMATQLLDFVFVKIGVPSLRGVCGWCAVSRVVFSAGFALVLHWLE